MQKNYDMTASPDDLVSENLFSQKKETVSLFMLLLSPLIILMTTVSYIEGLSKYVIVYGALCSIAFLIRGKIAFYKETLFFLLFVVWGSLGSLVAQSLMLFVIKWASVVQLFVLFLMISTVCTNAANIKCVLFSFLIGGCIVTYLMISSGGYVLGESTTERASGIVGNANAFAAMLDSLVLILLWFLQMTKNKIFKGILLCLIPVCFKLIISSGSRAGFLGLAMILAAWYYIFYFKLTFKKPLLALFMTIIIVGFGIYMVKNLAETQLLKRLTEAKYVAQGGGDPSAVSRVEVIKRGIVVAAHNPIVGVGLDNFRLYNLYGIYAHNNYIEVLADTGFIGTMLFYAIYICIIVKLLKIRKIEKTPMLNMILIYLFFDMFNWQIFSVTYALKETWIFLAVVVGYLNSMTRWLNTTQCNDLY